jgi:hypothetical protein
LSVEFEIVAAAEGERYLAVDDATFDRLFGVIGGAIAMLEPIALRSTALPRNAAKQWPPLAN